jgi:hypothetical protein
MEPPFLTFVLDEGELSGSRPGGSNSGERPSHAHLTGGWMGRRVRLDVVVKRTSYPCRELQSGRANRSGSHILDPCIIRIINNCNRTAELSDIAQASCTYEYFVTAYRMVNEGGVTRNKTKTNSVALSPRANYTD